MMRTVVCHYHIYKNAGTSFDLILEKNFGKKLISFDGPFPFFSIDQDQLLKIVERHDKAVGFSSHQVFLPTPVSLEINILPALFLRHPVLRVVSIYMFKRAKFDGTGASKAAQKMPFDEWIDYCFDAPVDFGAISNAQTRMVGGVYGRRSLVRPADGRIECDLEQAKRNLRSVTLLGRIEDFEADVKRFKNILETYGIQLKHLKIRPQNTTSGDPKESIETKLEKVCQSLGNERFEALMDANQQDLELREEAARLIAQSAAAV